MSVDIIAFNLNVNTVKYLLFFFFKEFRSTRLAINMVQQPSNEI